MPKRFVLAEEFTDPQLERELLAAIAANPELYWELLDLLVPEAMTETRPAFEELAAAVEQEKPLPAIEGQPTPNPVAAAKQLADLYQKRLLAELAQDFLQKLRTEVSATELITSLEERLAQVQRVAKEMRVGQVLSLPELLPDLLADVAARHEALKTKGKAVVGLPSGITKLDKLLGGFQPGLHLLAAEPGKGKTTFTLQVSAHVARAGFPVLFISFEEVLARLALKVICARAGLEAKKFGDGYGDPGELQRAAREYGRELACLHFVEGTARLTVPQLRAKALQIMNRWKKQR
ncbi:MAG: AAA family ATPase, partial [Moorella sp. (in: Bacteria)]|nr:AAA family ATPase [Moorella sp. (in: firmicutes)]